VNSITRMDGWYGSIDDLSTKDSGSDLSSIDIQ